MPESKPPRLQCAACPWKKSTRPAKDIPNGYSTKQHAGLARTIAEPGTFDYVPSMACHESPPGAEQHCVGWLMHQLNAGGNLALRLRVIQGTIDANVQTVGPQHTRFEDTLPRRPGTTSRRKR